MFMNVDRKYVSKNLHLVSVLSVVSRIYEKRVNNRSVDHLKKCGVF